MVSVPCKVETTAPDIIFPIEIWERAIGATITSFIYPSAISDRISDELLIPV